MNAHEAVKSLYLRAGRVVLDNKLLDAKWFVEQEINTWTDWMDVPVRRRLPLWRQGFLSPNIQLYDLENTDPEKYLSHLQAFRLYARANGDHRYLVDDKLSQHWMLADYPDSRPTAHGLLDRGYVHGVAGTELDADAVAIEDWLPETLEAESRLVLKQLRGEGGNQVIVCSHDTDGYRIDGEPVDEAELCEQLEPLSSYLVSAYVDQHDYAAELYPDSPNTIRILTVWDDETDDLYVPAACQRIGTDSSRPVDNFGAGGIAANLDVETGVLGQAVQYPFGGSVSRFENHPNTGERIVGVSIPHWDRIRTTVEEIARDNTNIPIIGWDVLLSESGEPTIIEANTGTHLDVLQAHRPLLADPDVTRVVSRYLPEVQYQAAPAP
ncbi:sugar-transfer associated ATP-grasp domain-containing protein [Halapricum desulfuricans]|uniref:Sugar-transfer associated ATP-grasp domain n=1 Tax=Halapricum desulfuricans TaxID=2841257 RepID=A0A897N566_9EURY|nr:sugar-transfer associated ATP-grasp domain-containing protein [Halapricum desulfuricans]QSG07744.1 Sugar-transfer associated ATP-grasp domain [Halapricum desulfuricans]